MMRDLAVDQPKGVQVASQSGDLAHFRRGECAALVWQRPVAEEFQQWIDALGPAHLPNGRCVLPRDEVRDAVTAFCDAAGTPRDAQRAHLIEDIHALSELFADLMKAPFLRLRLQVVNTDACRRFHTDAITARLICTYRGTGTQYGTSRNGDDPARIFTVPSGAPALLRGSLWPEHPASGLLHRSPPIEGTGETRLVLVIDPLLDPEEAA